MLKKFSGGGKGVVTARLPEVKPAFGYLPADDSWVEALPLSDENSGALAAIAGKADELKVFDHLLTELSTYSAYHRGRRNVPMPRLWHLRGVFKDKFRFPIGEKSSAKTTFALGESARKLYFPGVKAEDKIVYRQENGRHYVAFFPGKMSEKELLKAFLFRMDKAYPYVAATMSDWPAKVKSADKAFRKNQPTLDDAMVHPAYGVRFALKDGEIAVARRDGKLFLRTRFSDTHDIVTELIVGLNKQVEFGSSRRIPAGLGVTSDAMLNGERVYAAVDEAAPVKVTYGNIGGNHGPLTALTITVADHGFTVADIGKTTLLAGGRKYYIIKVVDKDNLIVMSENIGMNGIGYFDCNTMKRSFTCNGKEYNITKNVLTQLYPNSRVKKQNWLLDGKALPEGEFIIRGKKLTCDEVYEVVSPVSMLDKILKNPGKEINWAAEDVSAALEFANTYTFTSDGTQYLAQKVKFIERSALRQLGLLQTQIIPLVGKNAFREYFIPKTKAFESNDRKFDFAKGVNSTAILPRIYFDESNVADKNNLPERMIQIAGINHSAKGKLRETGLVIGYSLRHGATRPEIRRKNADKQPLWINITQKSYPFVMQSTGGVLIEKDTVIEASGYRKIFAPEKFGKIVPASYTVVENGKTLLYLHFAESGSVKLPAGFSTVVEKSADTLLSEGSVSGKAGDWIVLEQK